MMSSRDLIDDRTARPLESGRGEGCRVELLRASGPHRMSAGAAQGPVTWGGRLWRRGWVLGAILLVALGLRLISVRQPYVDVLSWRQSSTAMIADHYYREDWNILYPAVRWTGPPPGYQGREFQTVSYL